MDFFSTGHGKGACDGIGGIVKHYATIHNLRSKHLEGIKDASDFVNKVQNYSKTIKLLHIFEKDLQRFRKQRSQH